MSNLGVNNLGQNQQNTTTLVPTQTTAGQIIAVAVQQPHVLSTNVNSPMDVDSSLQSNTMPTLQATLTNFSASSATGLGNLPSAIGNIVTAVTTTPHSPLTTALQGGNNLTANLSPMNSQAKNTTAAPGTSVDPQSQILSRIRLQDLVREVDPTEQLDDEVEEVLLQMADDFVESAVGASCLLAKHRKGNTLEVKDLQYILERNWNMWFPGFGTDELRPYKRSVMTEAHKQRIALIRKAIKKY